MAGEEGQEKTNSMQFLQLVAWFALQDPSTGKLVEIRWQAEEWFGGFPCSALLSLESTSDQGAVHSRLKHGIESLLSPGSHDQESFGVFGEFVPDF